MKDIVAEKKIKELKEELNRHNYNYYVLAKPTISDYEFDKLLEELQNLEENFPQYITPDSPTQRVATDITKKFATFKHKVPMLSLANTYSPEELLDFDRKVKEALPAEKKINYTTELKIDGVSISIIYKAGKFYKAVTRGDGTFGEDVTNNIKTIKSLPLSIKGYNQDFEVRGEVFMEIKKFEHLNKQRMERGEKLFANPRNFTAGSIKTLNTSEVAKRPLDAFLYYLFTNDNNLKTQSENLELLKTLGFKINPNFCKCQNINEVLEYCKEWEVKRNQLPYEIDGVVVKVDSLEQQKKIGNIAKSPKWAVAYKFKAKQEITLLKSITWQVGRIGTLTPVAELDPVLVAGSKISRATLHNIDEIRKKDIREGDTVVIEKGGDVIPKVVSVVLDNRLSNLQITEPPSKCPVCGTPLYKPEGETNIFCENFYCNKQVEARIEHFASRNAMDIEGLGPAVIKLLLEKEIIKDYSDIYDIKKYREEILDIERMGIKSTDNLLLAIEESKKKPFDKVLFSLGIRNIGSETAKKIVKKFNSIEKLIEAKPEELEVVSEVGPIISQNLQKFFSDKKNIKLIKKLRSAGLNFSSSGSIITKSSKLLDKTFVLTGTLKNFTRSQAGEKIIALGGKTSSSISSKTDYLVAGENAGSKYDKALSLRVAILTEEKFLQLLEE